MMDYLEYWSILRKPFLGGDNPVFFAGVPQREAIAGLNYFVARGLSSALLTAAAGCGMTSLLQYVQQMRGFGDDAAEFVLTDGNRNSRGAVQVELCRALGYRNANAQDDIGSQIDRAIEATSRQRVKLIWLIDRCNQAAASVAGDLIGTHPEFSAIAGTTGLAPGALTAEFGQCPMRIELAPLTIEDTLDYLQHCVEHAGGNRRLFSDNAAVRLHEFTAGVLADLAVAAEASLALAAHHRLNEVTPAIVEAIAERTKLAA